MFKGVLLFDNNLDVNYVHQSIWLYNIIKHLILNQCKNHLMFIILLKIVTFYIWKQLSKL